MENGVLKKIINYEGSPLTSFWTPEGCPKAKAMPELVYHPNRLSYPLKRIAKRGNNDWQIISWDQGLDEVASRLEKVKKKWGPEALGVILGSLSEQWVVPRFCNLYGTPNVDTLNARVCGMVEAHINIVTYGGVAQYGPPRPKCNLVVLWGGNHANTSGIKHVHERKAGKHIVVDPRGTTDSLKADIWLQLRPGTDTALGLGWIHVIIKEELYDKDFVKNWTVGFEALRERVKAYPPERVEEITWVPKEKIIEAAKLYATTKPASIIWGTATGHFGRNVAEGEKTRCILRAITGNLDVEGGNHFTQPYKKTPTIRELELPEMLPPEQIKKALGSDRYKVMTWPGFELLLKDTQKTIRAMGVRSGTVGAIIQAIRTGEPYPLHALIVTACNPMVTMANTKHFYEALNKVDFSVAMDVFMTPTTVLADYVFPATFWLERPQTPVGLEHANFFYAGERVLPKSIAGKYDRRDDYDFWRGLSVRLGQEAYWPWETLEENLDYRFEGLGMPFQEFAQTKGWDEQPLEFELYRKEGFKTPTGKVELSSTIFEKLGYDPLPYYEEPAESPISAAELAKDYPYILISHRSKFFPHSQYRQSEILRKRHNEPLIQIHPETAKKEGIRNGDMVWIENQRGRIKQRCEIYEHIDPRVVAADFGWWFPERPGAEPSLFGVWESNVNVLTSDELDHAGRSCGNWYLGPVLCRIHKCKK
jgi:anaerobic selenocysteine-containing dehydrogenase